MDKEAAFGYALQAQHCVVATESWQGKRTGIFAFKMNISFFLDNQLPTIYFRQHKNGVVLHQRYGEASSHWNSLLLSFSTNVQFSIALLSIIRPLRCEYFRLPNTDFEYFDQWFNRSRFQTYHQFNPNSTSPQQEKLTTISF